MSVAITSRAQALALREEVRAEKARRSLAEFVRQAWPIVEPNPVMHFRSNWHVDAICDHLEAFTRGDIQRLVINIPPGYAKSLLVSVIWPAWVWASDPAFRAIFASYGDDLVTRDSIRTRDIIRSEWYRVRFMRAPSAEGALEPWEIKDDTDRQDLFVNTRGGARYALTVGGAGTGFRGDAVVVDDPLKAEDAFSKAARDKAIRWWDQTMSSRFNDMRKQRRLIIGQRLHEEDLTGHVLEMRGAGAYEHLCLPSEFESDRRCVTYIRRRDPETGAEIEKVKFFEDPRATDGELLFPALFPKHVLEMALGDLKAAGYAAQHQQRPAPAEGNVFKKSHWRFWKPDGTATEGNARRPKGCNLDPAVPLPPKFDRVIMSLDAAFKGKDTSDYVVFTVIGTRKAQRFVLDRVRGQMTFSETLAAFRMLAKRYPIARRKLVEDKANGTAVIDTLKKEITGIIAVEPEGGKESRAAAIQHEVESGCVFLPDGAPWLDEWIEEFAVFPKGKHDDQVDSLSQALIDLADSNDAARFLALAGEK